MKAFFSRVAALAFEQSVLQDLEKRPSTQSQVGDGDGDLIRAYWEGWVGLRSKIGTRRPLPASLTCHFCCPLGIFGLSAVSQAYSFYDPHHHQFRHLPRPPLHTGSCWARFRLLLFKCVLPPAYLNATLTSAPWAFPTPGHLGLRRQAQGTKLRVPSIRVEYFRI